MKNDRKPRQLHPLNFDEKQIHIPEPIDYGNEFPEKYKQDYLKRTSARAELNKVWLKVKEKVKQTVWLVNWEQRIVEFRFKNSKQQIQFKDKVELNTWLNIQLLKCTGITLDMYYVFFQLYTKKTTRKDHELNDYIHYEWIGIAPK